MDIPFEAYEGIKPYIFVSYAHKDKDEIYPEIKRLHEAGYRIWYDEGIPPASEWPREIAEAIENCELFLVFVSPLAVTSKYVKKEINYALKLDKRFLAVYIQKTILPSGLDYLMSDLQAIMKFQMLDDRYYQKLIKVLPTSVKHPTPLVSTAPPSSEYIPASQPSSQAVSPAPPRVPVSYGEYQGISLLSAEANVLTELEHQVGEPIPKRSSINWDIFGFTAKNKNVTGLGLYEQGLTSLPESFFELTNLQTLSLSSNQLVTLSESFFQLTGLKKLDLSFNKFTTLPESFGNLVNLKYVYLYENQLRSLPESFGELTQLVELDLSRNQLRSLPESIGQLTKLEYLDLETNELRSLPESIGQLTNLKELYLYNNELKTLPETLGQLTNFKELYLYNNELKTLPETFGNLKNLRTLWLYGNPLAKSPGERNKIVRLAPKSCTIKWKR